MSLAEARLYLCTPDREDLAHFIEECVAGGVDIVQLRESRLQGGELAERARLAHRVCAGLGVPYIVNDDPALAVEVGAEGAHVGQDDMAPLKARELLGTERLLGLSTHAVEELERGLEEPVDYVSVGPIVPTPTKPGRPGTGLEYVRQARRIIDAKRPGLPFFVTGNARPETVGEIVAAGASRVVVVRYLTEAERPRQAAQAVRGALEEALGQ